MFEHEDIASVRAWLRDLGFDQTPRDGWVDELGYIASITWNPAEGKWYGAHTRPMEELC